MARVRSIGKSNQTVRPHPTSVDCEWQVIEGPEGPLLHISTFGSDDRQSARKSSQSIQIDQAQARELVSIIMSAFMTR